MLVAAGKFGKTDAACSHCCLALCGVDGKVCMHRSRDECWLAAKANYGTSLTYCLLPRENLARPTLHAPIAALPCVALMAKFACVEAEKFVGRRPQLRAAGASQE